MSIKLLEAINARMHQGRCPTAGDLGECAALDYSHHPQLPADRQVSVWAAVCVWDRDFNDAAQVAGWFIAEGATTASVAQTLHDPDNEIHNGLAPDGAREWNVTAHFPATHPHVAWMGETGAREINCPCEATREFKAWAADRVTPLTIEAIRDRWDVSRATAYRWLARYRKAQATA